MSCVCVSIQLLGEYKSIGEARKVPKNRDQEFGLNSSVVAVFIGQAVCTKYADATRTDLLIDYRCFVWSFVVLFLSCVWVYLFLVDTY